MVSIQRVNGPMETPALKQAPPRLTLVRKRDDTDLDIDRAGAVSSPGKKPRVTFDTQVKVRIMDNNEKSPELVQEEVRRAIDRHKAGDDAAYHKLEEVYKNDERPPETQSLPSLKMHTMALLSNVSALGRSCSSLVHAILSSDWLGKDEVYVMLYLRFLGSLVSAQGFFLGDVLRMLVENLTSCG